MKTIEIYDKLKTNLILYLVIFYKLKYKTNSSFTYIHYKLTKSIDSIILSNI